MDDVRIIELYWQRDKQAITETQTKYSKYLYSIAHNILKNKEDAEECENDTYLAAWNTIPPQKPQWLSAFLGKITRNLSLKKFRLTQAKKRGGKSTTLPIDELYDCIAESRAFEYERKAQELASVLNTFLKSLDKEQRRIFVCRYWYCDSISDIAKQFGYSQSKVKMALLRTRQKLLEFLNKEEIYI